MQLALFSQNVTDKHKEYLPTLFDKPLEDVNFLYINTPGNYKPYKSEWMVKGEERWRNIFPKFQEFDIERAYRVDKAFKFQEYLSQYEFIYISGGSAYILAYWLDKTGSRQILHDLVMNNKAVYGGESAGAIFAYKNLDNYKELDHPEKPPQKIDTSLGFIDFAPIPHWENEEFQKGLVNIKNKFENEGVKTIEINDDQAIFVKDEEVLVL